MNQDKILYPKELYDLELTKQELYDLELQMFRKEHLDIKEELYQNNEGNIRIKQIFHENEESIEIQSTKNLMAIEEDIKKKGRDNIDKGNYYSYNIPWG